MIGRRSVIGLSLFSALLACAFAAQSASAIKPTHSLNTTMVTCVKVASGQQFADAHCDDGKGGEYAHAKVEKGTTTKIAATNANITNGTKDAEPAVFRGTLGLSKFSVECSVVANDEATSTLTNTEPAEGQHTVSGFAETKFSTCNVKELAKCIVAEPITFNANITGVEGMKGPKGEANAMGSLFVGSGAEERFTEIEFKNKGGEICALKNQKFPIKGSMVATNGPTTESVQNGKGSGTTLVFTPKFEMQTLKWGPNVFTLEMTVTLSNSTTKTPLSMTTGT